MLPKIVLTIPTLRLDESLAFYTDVLQFKLDERMDRPNGVVLAFLGHPCGFVVEFVQGPMIPAGEIGSGAPLLTFITEDFKDISARLTKVGVDVPTTLEIPGGISMLRFKDPNGVTISFVAGVH
jgi:catechol 2,3-dioxygenase-like lactoylglutathione lyase family enzyme